LSAPCEIQLVRALSKTITIDHGRRRVAGVLWCPVVVSLHWFGHAFSGRNSRAIFLSENWPEDAQVPNFIEFDSYAAELAPRHVDL
jgi:hypothetical protein